MNPEEVPSKEAPTTSNWKSLTKELLIFAVIAGGIVLPFRIFIAEPYLVDGRSMDPTFATGDYLIVDKISDRTGTPERNSVLVFGYPNDPKNNPDRSFLAKIFSPGTNFIKRIIGLPGETVIMKDGVVTIINSENPNGFKIDESYVVHTCQNTPAAPKNCVSSFQKTLAGDEYFVMGDNRAESFDSRYWGPLQKKYLLGKPVVRLFGIKWYGKLPIPILSKFSILPGNDSK